MNFCVTQTGWYLPPTIQTAAELAPLVGRSAEWISSRTGVAERRISELSMDRMGAIAARAALGDGPPPDLILNASLTPVQLIPDSSVFIQAALGLSGIPSYSLHATCMSFLVALRHAGLLVHHGAYRRVLIVSAEQGSSCRDLSHPESAVLIGDGAAAAVIEPAQAGSGLLAFNMTTWPEGAGLAEIRGCGTRAHPNDPATTPQDNLFRMSGPRIFRHAVQQVTGVLDTLFADAGLAPSDVDWVVPHQASGPALDTIPRWGFAPERVINIIGQTGNCIAASMPMALHQAHRSGQLQRGDTVLLLGTGAGLSVAAALLRW